MQDRLVHIAAPKGRIAALRKLAKRDGVELQGVSALERDRRVVTVLVRDRARQDFFDDVQKELNSAGNWRLTATPVEAIIPEFKGPDDEKVVVKDATQAREELQEEIEKGAAITVVSMSLTLLSAIVASVGMIQDSIAVIIGAMVIAPLLGPILAVTLGAALGDMPMIRQAVASLAFKVSLAVSVGLAVGLTVPFENMTDSIADRARVGADDIALALASGAAAALSVLTGISGVLVGVMVAAALLPPAVATGLLIGEGMLHDAGGAGLLLAINIAALMLAGQIVFLLQGLRPRTWYRRKEARQSVAVSVLFSMAVLAVVGAILVFRSGG